MWSTSAAGVECSITAVAVRTHPDGRRLPADAAAPMTWRESKPASIRLVWRSMGSKPLGARSSIENLEDLRQHRARRCRSFFSCFQFLRRRPRGVSSVSSDSSPRCSRLDPGADVENNPGNQSKKRQYHLVVDREKLGSRSW